jgi:protein SCO1/2
LTVELLSLSRRHALLLSGLALAGWVAPGLAHKPKAEARLSKIGPAPDFALIDQDGKPVSLKDWRGEVVAVTFIYASCVDTCPLLTAKLVGIQRKLEPNAASKVFFAAITVDPERDTPEVLKRYGQAHGADGAHWAFLTGTPEQIDDVTKRYGIYRKKQQSGDVDHTFLTSLIDRSGTLRVQYLGWRFDPNEFLSDLRSLLREPRSG